MMRIGRNKGASSMAHKFLTRRFITWRVLPLLLIGLVGAWFALKPGLSAFVSKPGLLAGRSAAVGSNMPQDEFEQRVRTYLVDHPEVIVEAMNRLEARQGPQETAEAQAVLKSHIDAVFRDPGSPVGANPAAAVTLAASSNYTCPYSPIITP